MKKFKVLLVLEDNTFFIADFLNKLLNIKKNYFEIKYIFIVTKVKKKQNINYYMIRNLLNLHAREFFKLIFKFFQNKYRKLTNDKYNLGKIISKKNIKYKKINYKISNYYDEIVNINPDLIVNSSSLYFIEKIIKLPKYGCINRHSSILPAGGGFFPIFYALVYDEPVGTTIHFMKKNIDKGEIIIQKKINMNDKINTVFKIYEKSFSDSSFLICDAIKLIFYKKDFFKYKKVKSSYRSFPLKKDWKIFRKKQLKWI